MGVHSSEPFARPDVKNAQAARAQRALPSGPLAAAKGRCPTRQRRAERIGRTAYNSEES